MDIQNQLNSNQRTAVGVHVGQGLGGQGGVHGVDLGAEVLLPGDLLGGDAGGFLVHGGSSIGSRFSLHFISFSPEIQAQRRRFPLERQGLFVDASAGG